MGMFMDPVKILAACSIQSTNTVADFGAGSGFVAQAAASLVPQGQVFAIEINKELVTRITRDAVDHRLSNLHVLWGDVEEFEGTKLAAGSVDIVLCFNILFVLEDKADVVKEAFRVLKTGGKIVVVDWTESFGGLGPQPHHIFTQAMAEALLTSVGFKKRTDTLPAGDHHYAILFEK
ncbi:MAG: type 11 methyltransferase [Candidatus Nomurabacteria bacterium]|nr:type 11 methyltransferase [Candidatus Nomurabacteria bacterium]